jgi:hypothetical protein
MKTKALKELDLKAIVLTQLRKQRAIDRNTILTTEYSISTSNLRADLAILGSEFIGVEIKSEVDTLRRLSRQLLGYLSVFDRVILVIAEKHWNSIKEKDLGETEIWRVDNRGSVVSIHSSLRSNLPVERINLVSLMTKRERAMVKMDFATASEIYQKEIFSKAFRKRFSKTSLDFWKNVGRRKINNLDLELLSRFRDRRILAAQAIKERHDRHTKMAEHWVSAGNTT